MKRVPFLLIAILFSPRLEAQTAEAQKGFQPLVAALHVHSTYSDGELEILELGSEAHQRKIDVLGITDSYLTRVRYGVGPFKKLVSKTVSRKDVMERGLDQYFESIARAQQRFDDVVVLPGLEVAPYYYWKGQWPGNLELHDFDRHILVFGMKDRNAIKNLPVIENATWANTQHNWIGMAGPVALSLGGLLVMLLTGVRRRSRVVLGIVLLLGGGAWAYDRFPFGELSDPYSGKPNIHAFQQVIDYVVAHGGLAFWSYPEARYPDIQSGGALMVSRGQPEVLPLTDDYRGIEGIYGDNITITKPGNLWDRLLVASMQNGRKTWPSVITGIDFHNFKAGNGWFQLDQGLTILFASGKNENAVIDALKSGRGYATFQKDPAHRVALNDFALRSAGNSAVSGETLTSNNSVEFSATVDWMPGESKSSEATAEISIVRDGVLLDQSKLPLPAVIHRQDTLDAGRHYYRIMIQFDGSQILSNPIFCDVQVSK